MYYIQWEIREKAVRMYSSVPQIVSPGLQRESAADTEDILLNRNIIVNMIAMTSVHIISQYCPFSPFMLIVIYVAVGLIQRICIEIVFMDTLACCCLWS